MLKLAIVLGLGAAAWYWRKDIAAVLEGQFPGLLRETTARILGETADSADRFYGQARARLENG